MVNLGLCKTARPWFQNLRLQDTKSPENETSRPITNTSEISRSGTNYQRPTLLEEPFYTPITLQLIAVTGHRSQVTRASHCSIDLLDHA